MTLSLVKSLTAPLLRQAIVVLALGVPFAALPGPAQASTVPAIAVYSADLNYNWGGPLDQVTQSWGGAVVNGAIYSSGGIVMPSGLTEYYNQGSAGYQAVGVKTSPTMFAYEYAFTVGSASNPQGTFVSNFGGLTNVSLALYQGMPSLYQATPVTGTNPQGASVAPVDVGVFNGSGGTAGQYILQMAGLTTGTTYYLTVAGDLAPGSTMGDFYGIGEVSAVPLPATLLMFGSAIVGLSGLAERRRLGTLVRKVAHQATYGMAVIATLGIVFTAAFAGGAKAAAYTTAYTDSTVLATQPSLTGIEMLPLSGLILGGPAGRLSIPGPGGGFVSAPNLSSFTFEYQFALSSSSDIVASLSQLHTTLTSGSQFELFAGAAPQVAPAQMPAPLAVSQAGAVPGELYLSYAGPSGTGLAPGTYYLAVMGGLASGQTHGSLSGTLAISPVPLPTALLLFGTAIGGLAIAERFGRNARA